MNARALHEAFRRGQRNPVDVLEERVPLIGPWQERTHLFVDWDLDRARKAAEASWGRYQDGTFQSEWDGILVGLKDLIDVEGQRTSAGSGLRLQHRADRDAAVTRRLREAGALYELGKLNLHEFAYGPTGASSYFGPVGNPWDPKRMSGGSSSGSAVAVASGIVRGALGTDTGGSVRIPAALSGISGLKPTYGVISTEGVVPLSWSLDHVGPMARTVDDVQSLWHLLTGHAGVAPPGRRPRVFWPEASQIFCYDKELDTHVQETIRKILGALDAEVTRGPLMDLEEIWLAQSIIIGSEALSYHWGNLSERAQDYQPDVRERLTQGGAHLAVEYLAALRWRQETARRYDAWFQAYDWMILPTVPVVAPYLTDTAVTNPAGASEDVRAVLTRFTAPFNFLGIPALSLPFGLFRGLPVGIQLVAPRGQDDWLLAWGQDIQRRFPDSMAVPPGALA